MILPRALIQTALTTATAVLVIAYCEWLRSQPDGALRARWWLALWLGAGRSSTALREVSDNARERYYREVRP